MFSLVLPFHTDSARLAATVARVEREGERWGVRELLLCHNGRARADGPGLLGASGGPRVRSLHTDTHGIGAGYKLGIAHATEDYVILSASDLPFGFSDVEAFLDLRARESALPHLALGSKAHPDSQLHDWPLMRRGAGAAFYLLRRVLLGRDTPGDSQGSLIVRTEDARALAAARLDDGYLFSLELATLFLREGKRVVELPVRLSKDAGPSSVSLVSDSVTVVRGVWRLARRVRARRG